MKPLEKYVISGVIIFLVFAYFFKGCNTEYKDKIVFIDSSGTKELKAKLADYDTLADHWANINLQMEDSIKNLNERLKSAKNRFIVKYLSVRKDSLLTDSNCLLTLEYANQTILQYDSMLNLQSRSLNNCFEQSASKDSLITFLREFSNLKGEDNNTLIEAISRFRHVFWRIYWRSKK